MRTRRVRDLWHINQVLSDTAPCTINPIRGCSVAERLRGLFAGAPLLFLLVTAVADCTGSAAAPTHTDPPRR
jgi:hypothetical protein